MKNVLITGANRGIGLEFVKQYLLGGCNVIACCRDPENAGALQALANPRLEILPLDVSDNASISALPGLLRGREISIFINNAGIYGQGQTLEQVDCEEWLSVFQVNTIAPMALSRELLPLMSKTSGKMLYLSSKMGSIAENSSGSTYVYRTSKTALNQVVKSLSVDLADKGILVAALHPGWVLTDMGGPNALIDTETSVTGMMDVIEHLDSQGSGQFFNYNAEKIPW